MRDEKITKNLGLIYKVIKDLHCKYNVRRDDEEFDEIYIAGVMGLISGVDTYKPGIVKENTYYYKCIKNSILHLFTIRTSPTKSPKLKNASLDKEFVGTLQLIDVFESDINIEQDAINKDLIERILKALDKVTNKMSVDIFCKYYGIGYTPKTMRELAKEYELSFSAICFRVQWVLKKLRKELENEIF